MFGQEGIANHRVIFPMSRDTALASTLIESVAILGDKMSPDETVRIPVIVIRQSGRS
jgi:hypothetical protein